jgi:hypothetical protein
MPGQSGCGFRVLRRHHRVFPIRPATPGGNSRGARFIARPQSQCGIRRTPDARDGKFEGRHDGFGWLHDSCHRIPPVRHAQGRAHYQPEPSESRPGLENDTGVARGVLPFDLSGFLDRSTLPEEMRWGKREAPCCRTRGKGRTQHDRACIFESSVAQRAFCPAGIAVEPMNQVTQQTVANGEESAGAAEELYAQAAEGVSPPIKCLIVFHPVCGGGGYARPHDQM